MSTKEIDRIGEDMIRSMGCIPNFLNYGGFPGSFCISLNDEVVTEFLRRTRLSRMVIW